MDKGSIITDRSYANTADAAKSFLEKYQAYSKLDSTEMIAMLANLDPTQNTTIVSGDLKLTITHKDLTGTAFGDSINFRWVCAINGCEYLYINAAFTDGVFSGFIDHRARYSIGNTTVNISKEQAIAIAMEAIKNYSYRMSDDWVVTGFNVTEDKTVANLIPTVKEGNVLYPAWTVTLPLNGTWPGSVTELLVEIWAGSGEVHFVHHQAYGGSGLPSDSNSKDLLSNDNSGSESSTSPVPSSENNAISLDIGTMAIVAVAAITGAVVAGILLVKKRSK